MIYLWRLEGDKLVLNLKEILKYDELGIIYRRDKSNDKMIAYREFRYLDFICDRDSYCVQNGFSNIESHNFAVEHSGMPKTYAPDDIVKKAISVCRRLNGGIIEGLIDTTIEAFRIDAKLMAKVKKLAAELEKKAVTVNDISSIMDLTKATINMSAEIPGKVSKLLALKEEYNNSKSKTSEALKRGGGEISNSYDGTGMEQHSDSGEVERLD